MTIQKSRSGYIGVSHIILFLYAIIVACMISGYKGIANYIAFGAMLALLFLWLLSNNWRVGRTKELLFAAWFMLYYVVTSFFDLDLSYFMTYTAYNLLLLFPLFICLIMERSQNPWLRKGLLRIALTLWFAMGVYMLIFYTANPSAARLAVSHQEMDTGVIIGGYQFAYGSSLLVVYFCTLLFDRQFHNRKIKGFLLAGILILAVAVYLTESTLTTFSMILGVVAVVIFDRNRMKPRSPMKRAMTVALLTIALVAGYLIIAYNSATIAAWLDQRSDILFYNRVGEVVDAVFLDTETGHYNKRISLIERSWNAFLSSPVLGVGYQYGNVFSAGKVSGIGNHSEIIDTLARYGIIGSIPALGIYWMGFKRIRGSCIGLAVACLFMLFCNPFRTFGSHLILFVIIPLMEHLISRQKDVISS